MVKYLQQTFWPGQVIERWLGELKQKAQNKSSTIHVECVSVAAQQMDLRNTL